MSDFVQKVLTTLFITILILYIIVTLLMFVTILPDMIYYAANAWARVL